MIGAIRKKVIKAVTINREPNNTPLKKGALYRVKGTVALYKTKTTGCCGGSSSLVKDRNLYPNTVIVYRVSRTDTTKSGNVVHIFHPNGHPADLIELTNYNITKISEI